jgi:hypothetical protein
LEFSNYNSWESSNSKSMYFIFVRDASDII